MTNRVLITGATGLIGRQTVRPLRDRGYEIIALNHKAHSANGIESIRADILDPASRIAAIRQAKATHLLHLAWHDGPQGRWTAPENMEWSTATFELVREFAAEGGRRAVCVGSCAEYDWSYEVLAESTPLRPTSVYGRAKASTGTLLTEIAPNLGLSLAWARIFFCYGPGEPRGRLLGDLLHGLSAGQTVLCTNGKQERDYMHTGDIAEALAVILDGNQTGPINVASGETVLVKDLIEITAELMQRPDLIKLGARDRPINDPPILSADVALLRSSGFRPKHDLRSGLADCVNILSDAPRSRRPND